MKKTNLTLLLFLCCANLSFSQPATEHEQVKQALLDYVEGFYEGDTAKIIRSVSPAAIKYGYWKSKGSAYSGEPMSFHEMIQYATDVKTQQRFAKPGAIKKTELYDVQDQTACGKVTAWWGTDYILLSKVDGRWMIRMVLWQSPPN